MSQGERMSSAHAEQKGPARLPSKTLVLYVRLVMAIGAAAIVWSIPGLVHIPHPFVWLLLVGLALVAGQFAMKIASVTATFSVTDTFFMASAIFFGPAPATITVALSSAFVSYRRGHKWERLGFNTAALSLSMWIAAHAFFLLAKVAPLAQAQTPIGQVMWPLVVLAVTYFLFNSGLMAVAIGLDSGQSPLVVWRKHFLWLSLSFFAAGSVAFCLILLVEQVSFVAAVMMIPLVIIFHLTLRASYGRLEDAQAHLASMDRLYLSTIETLAMAIDAKDDVTHSHVRRVQAYAVGVARALGITDDSTIKAIKAAALLHDTGKLAVPEHILNKPGGLTASEFDTMKLHVDVGADILSLVDFPYPVVPIVRCHHENWDGTGYPRGVSGEDIPIGARILSIVDCYDALTSDRPYRRALSDEAALDILRSRRGTMYDPAVVDLFIAVHLDIDLGGADRPEQTNVLQQIGRSRAQAAAGIPHAVPSGEPLQASDDVLAFVSLARLASGELSLADVLALTSKLMRDVVPGASAAWYVLDASGMSLTVLEASGRAAPALRGMTVGLGERLSGWVAANRQVIVNSDAGLDLGPRTTTVTPALESCMSLPLVSGDALVGVLSLYTSVRNGFTDDQGRLVQMVTPHVAQAIARAQKRPAEIVPINRDLRLVASR